MARRSQCSDAGDNPLDPNYLPPHYREEYRLAIDALVEENVEGYYKFLQLADVVDFLSPSEIDYIQNFIQLPKQSGHPEHHFLDTGGDGSSDTYWPLHSDLDAPGLDLGWPQIHHFIGPTEVTTLVNPAAPDMPTIKEQARRLIKKAQMVIAIVMDMFTDVDIFADILNAAMRNVAVYILLDEANVDHFINMVNNCRVNLQGIQFLRVRTVSGIRYHCRSGKSFKGQMLDRFLLTDCRAVLSGNYSFMWSYEKLHRCMAHLFLGQLVSTFDEEFRILFAQSEPLIIENMEDISVLQKRPYPGERPMLGDTRKYRTIDTAHPDEWPRQPYEDMDRRLMPLKRQETFHGPMDMYSRFPTQQTRLDPQTRLEPPFDQGPPRIPMMEGLAHKRHSFGEGGPGRYNLPYQQGFPDVEPPPGRPFYRGQQLHPGHDPDYGGYDKFWNQDFHQEEQYPESGYPPEIEPHEGFDPVLNYLSSARNVDIDQSSDKLIPGPDLPYTTTHPRRVKVGQPYACQTSPTPSNTTEKRFLQEHTSDRKDPTVKRGLRNWRISSYLSAYEDTGESEGLPMGQGQTIDPFEELPIQQPPPPPVIELSVPKIPNVREFKVPALPRASQMPAFAKTTLRDLPKKLPDEFPAVAPPNVVVPEIKTTPTPSESSSTTDGEKQEEVEPREPITSVLRREDSFRRKYNAAVHRSSRLRSSLIFSSLDQNSTQDNKTVPGEQEEDGTKTETEQTKLPFSQVLAQRRSGAREPFEWRSYIKTTDSAKAEENSGKQPEKGSDNKLESLPEGQEVGKSQEVAPNVEKLDVGSLPKPSQNYQPKIEQPTPVQQPTKSFLSEPFVDMNDADQRLMFFRELAAQRRAKAAEEAKLKQERAIKDKKEEPAKEEVVQKDVEGTIEKAKKDNEKSEAKTLDASGEMDKLDTVVKKDPTSMQSHEKLNTKVATDSDKIESKQSQVSQPISSEEPLQEKSVSKPAVTQDMPIGGPVATAPANVKLVTDENQPATTTDATSKDPQLKNSKSVPDFAKHIGLDLLSSLPSARLYERSTSQEANKEVQLKSRLWSPSLHKRELLKPFADKQKCISTVVQIEEATEEPSQTFSGQNQEKPSVKLNISDKTQPKQSLHEDSIGKTMSATQNKEEKSTVLPTISEKATPQQPQNDETSEKSVSGGAQIAKEASPSQSLTSKEKEKPAVLSSVSEKVQPQPSQNEDKLINSASQTKDSAKEQSVTIPSPTKTTLPTPITGTTQGKNEESLTISTPAIKEDTIYPIQPQAIPSVQSTTKDKTTVLPAKESINKDSLVKSTVSEESKKQTQSFAAVESPKQDKPTTSISDQTQPRTSESSVKSSGIQTKESSENPTPVQSVVSGELPSQEKAKTAQKQSLDLSVDEKSTSSVVQVENSTQKPTSQETLNIFPTISENKEPRQPEKMEEKSKVEVEESTERSCQKEEALSMEKPDKLPSTSEKVSLEQSGKETVEETTKLHSVEEKASIVPKEEAKVTSDSNLAIPSDSKDGAIHEKSSSMMPTEKIDQVDPISQSIEETKQKSTIPEEFTQLESHSNTSSPASFATALEFISSEESDILSPGRTDPNSLFKSGNVDSSVSDSSDFETPNSDFSRSPMPTTINMDDATEDKISIAETVIEAAPRRISAAAEDVNMDIGSPQTSQECSPKEDAQTEPPQEHLSPETTSDSNLKSAIVQSEVKGSTHDATTPLATSTEVAGSDSPVQNKTAKSCEDEKTAKSETEQVASNKQTEVNKASVVSPTNVKTQDITSQPETKAVTSDTQNELNKETIASPTNPAASEDKQDTMVDKTPQVTTKEKSKSTEESNKSVDVKSTDLVVSTAKSESETKAVSSNASSASQSPTSPAISEVTNEAKTSDKVSEKSQNEISEGSDTAVAIKSESERRAVSSKTEPSNPSVESPASKATSQVTDAIKMADKTLEICTKEKSGSTGEINLESKTETGNESTEVKGQNVETSTVKSESESEKASPVLQEAKLDKDKTPEITTQKTSAPTEKSNIDSQKDVTKEPNSTDVKSETKPPTAQPKQQPKPIQSRYLSSTANVISSSNLRDDTKILLEQISANSQSRNEMTAKEAPVTDDEKEDKADKNAKRKKENELKSLGQQKASHDRDKLLERIQTMRKDRKVYSRFEV